MSLYSYKLTHDSGFAPNPFGGCLTLATCKPGIRQTKELGDWIAGFTSGKLSGCPVGEERLVYLMRVLEKLPIAEYFDCGRFANKVPDISAGDERSRIGDNIYRPLRPDAIEARDFEQLENPNHWDGKQNCSVGDHTLRDTGGHYVLVADEFVYFGREALFIPEKYRPKVPKGMSRWGVETSDEQRVREFVDFVFDLANGKKILAAPHSWPDGDTSWASE
jgi:hypothetical protein